MRRGSELIHHEIYVLAGVIAAHASYSQEGFRQKDIKFMIEMMSNWMDMTFPDSTLNLHNTQIMRFLTEMVREGFAQRFLKNKVPTYKLTRVGLIAILGKLVQRPAQFPLEHFYFIFHFVEALRTPLENLIKAEGQQFPLALKIEVESLLDVKRLIQRQLDFVQTESRKLKQRINDNLEVIQIVQRGRKIKLTTSQIILEIEKKFPYDLNSQKPLSELYNDMPEGLRDFILDSVLEKRTNQIWTPISSVLEKHLEMLEQLKQKYFV